MRTYLSLFLVAGCASEPAVVTLINDFNNPDAARQPPWILCDASYNGTDLALDPPLAGGEASEPVEVEPGLARVLMVASWGDAACTPDTTLPLVTAVEEETLPGQTRDILVGLPNHRGPCPPEGIEPMAEADYDAVLAAFPDYGFEPYATREANPQCAD